MADTSNLTTDLFNRLTLGVVGSLEKRPGVSDVHLKEILPAERHLVISWEQQNSCIFPDDLKKFYQTSNGFHLNWNISFEDQSVHLGHMEVLPVEKVLKLAGGRNNFSAPSLADVDYDSEDELEASIHVSHGRKCPHFDMRSRVFELDPCSGYGMVCLVYRNTKQGVPATESEIWFLDRSLHWHFIAVTFSQYFRLMIMNLGLPLWHLSLTDIGLPNFAQQWFYMYAPLKLDFEQESLDNESQKAKLKTKDEIQNKIDVNRVFKGKADKKSKALSSTSSSKKKSSKTSGGTVRATLSTSSKLR